MRFLGSPLQEVGVEGGDENRWKVLSEGKSGQ
jgi:hypothetical protein